MLHSRGTSTCSFEHVEFRSPLHWWQNNRISGNCCALAEGRWGNEINQTPQLELLSTGRVCVCWLALPRYLIVAALGVVHIETTVAHGTVGALAGGQRVEASAHRVPVHDEAEAAVPGRIGARGGLQVLRRLGAAAVAVRSALHARVCIRLDVMQCTSHLLVR